jgi:hypothetical protein
MDITRMEIFTPTDSDDLLHKQTTEWTNKLWDTIPEMGDPNVLTSALLNCIARMLVSCHDEPEEAAVRLGIALGAIVKEMNKHKVAESGIEPDTSH